NDRPAAEAHDRHARRESATIGKPLDKRAYRRDVPQTESASADDAVTEIEQPQLVGANTDAAQQITAAPQQRRAHADGSRSDSFQPFARDRRREAEEDDRSCEDPDDLRQRPVARRGNRDAERTSQCRIENTP